MMLIPTHHFRDIERKPEYLQPEKCAPPPFPGPAGAMWFIRDGCGIACAIVTWFLVLYAEFVVLFVMLVPSRDYAYSIINGIVFNLLAFLALASHCRAMLTDPVTHSSVPALPSRCLCWKDSTYTPASVGEARWTHGRKTTQILETESIVTNGEHRT
eukprot:XP_006512321.1 PREDICTED: palmitoyltransferase ZDHHC3 isoform X9 [Mus musculus]